MDALLATVICLAIPVLFLQTAVLAFTVRERFLDYKETKNTREYDGPPTVRR